MSWVKTMLKNPSPGSVVSTPLVPTMGSLSEPSRMTTRTSDVSPAMQSCTVSNAECVGVKATYEEAVFQVLALMGPSLRRSHCTKGPDA
ncbi:MAG TPA: hypothetical protein VM618_03585 [Acidimicrobiia bacterium]|nr:hypothetical protein [Acidimicrobiia bacterium]